MSYDDARRRVHEAVGGLLDDGEIAVAWTLTIDVAGPNDTRYLAHRAGGGIDGAESPSVGVAEAQLLDMTEDADDDEDD